MRADLAPKEIVEISPGKDGFEIVGKLDRKAIWKGTLSKQEVQQVYDAVIAADFSS